MKRKSWWDRTFRARLAYRIFGPYRSKWGDKEQICYYFKSAMRILRSRPGATMDRTLQLSDGSFFVLRTWDNKDGKIVKVD